MRTVGVLAACALTALAFALPATAAAQDPRVERVNRVATDVWGPALAQTCPSGLAVSYEAAPDPSWFGWAWANDCTVRLNADKALIDRWPLYCDTVLHETGHVLGFDHDHADHNEIMRPSTIVRDVSYLNGRRTVRWLGVNPACQPPQALTARRTVARPNMAYASGTLK